MSQSSKEDDPNKTVAVRIPADLWWRVKERAVARRETGLSWMKRALEVCLRKVDGKVITGADVEPDGSDVSEKTERPTRTSRPSRSFVEVPGSNAEAMGVGFQQTIDEQREDRIAEKAGGAHVAHVAVPEKKNGPVAQPRTIDGREMAPLDDHWGMTCSRTTCGHGRRRHLHKGQPSRCDACGCPGFIEPTEG